MEIDSGCSQYTTGACDKEVGLTCDTVLFIAGLNNEYFGVTLSHSFEVDIGDGQWRSFDAGSHRILTGKDAKIKVRSDEDVTSVTFDTDTFDYISFKNAETLTTAESMCEGLFSLTEFRFASANLITTMNKMMYGCSSLTHFGQFFSDFVVNMDNAFYGTVLLDSVIDVNTSSCTSMIGTFNQSGISSLPESFTSNTSLVESFERCFNKTQNLTVAPSLDYSSTVSTSHMFASSRLETVENIVCPLLVDASYMFYACYYLTSYDNVDTSTVTNFDSYIASCTTLKCIDKIDTTGVGATKVDMFTNTPKLLLPGPTDISALIDTGGSLYVNPHDDCVLDFDDRVFHANITTVDETSLTISLDTDFYIVNDGETSVHASGDDAIIVNYSTDPIRVFTYGSPTTFIAQGYSSIGAVRLVKSNTITSLENAFKQNVKMTTFEYVSDDTGWSLSNVNSMFNGCTSLTYVTDFDWSSVVTSESCFRYCKSLANVRTNTSLCTNTESMFEGCTVLDDAGINNTSNSTNMNYMYKDCINLSFGLIEPQTQSAVSLVETFSGTSKSSFTIDLASAENISGLFFNCLDLTDVILSNTGSITNYSDVFNSCSSLSSIGNMDMSGALTTEGMFYGCKTLTQLNFDVDSQSCLNFNNMFYNCFSLGCLTGIDTTAVGASKNNMFYMCDSMVVPNSTEQDSIVSTGGLDFNAVSTCDSLPSFKMEIGLISTSSPIKIGIELSHAGIFQYSVQSSILPGSIFTSIELVAGANTVTVPSGASNLQILSTNDVTNIRLSSDYITYGYISIGDTLTSLVSAFSYCSSLKSVNIYCSSLLTDISSIARGTPLLESFYLSDYSGVTHLTGAFRDSGIKTLPRMSTVAGQYFNQMFNGSSLECLQGIDTTSSVNTTDMFANCTNLVTPTASEQTTILAGSDWTSTTPCGA